MIAIQNRVEVRHMAAYTLDGSTILLNRNATSLLCQLFEQCPNNVSPSRRAKLIDD